MAQREGQGLQIAVICFAMLTIILAITTYIFYAQSQTAYKDLAVKTKSLNDNQSQINKLTYHVKAMQYVLGAGGQTLQDVELAEKSAGGPDAVTKEVLDNFNADIALVGEQIAPEGPRNYRIFTNALLASLAKKNASVADAIEQSRKAQQDKEAAELAAKTRAEVAETASATAVKDYDAQKQLMVADRAKSDEEKKVLADQISTVGKRHKDELQRETDAKEVFIKQNTTLTNMNRVFSERLKEIESKEGSLFENPDGQITTVNQRQRLVWINVGRADGLRKQTTFSVFDHNEKGVTNAKRKARIEVVSVDDHLSEARILEDTPANPIIAGDVIFTPAWSPGQRIHFALAMKMDINKDGIDDYDMVKNIILMNGGVIDAELRPDGTRGPGKITVGTRYFVEGEKPTELTEASSPELMKQWTAFQEEREQFGVEKISVAKLMSLMGWKAEERTVELAGPRMGGDFRKTRSKTQPATSSATDAAAPAAEAPTTPTPAAGAVDPFAPSATPAPAGKASPPAEADPFAAPR